MQIYLARNNQQAGPYSLDQVNQMLANQQVLLTDLAWHEGMSEWKALGELTQGKLVYTPTGHTSQFQTQQPFNNEAIQNISVEKKNQKIELASYGSRIFAKFIDMLIWLPAFAIPSFFIKAENVEQLNQIQQQMVHSTSSAQISQLQTELFSLIPVEAWQTMFFYIIIMLAIQALFLAKSGQSIGKKIAKIKIVDAETNNQVPLTRIFLIRSVIFVIFNIIFFPFVVVIDSIFGLNKNRQTLHDKLGKTKVIKL